MAVSADVLNAWCDGTKWQCCSIAVFQDSLSLDIASCLSALIMMKEGEPTDETPRWELPCAPTEDELLT